MTVLKWLLIIVSAGYACGLLTLFFAQRALLFPSPTSARTAPKAAGFREVEEHVLTTSDGEKVIAWYVPARPGRPVVLYFHGNGDFLAGFFGRFRSLIADGTGVVALSYRGYAGSTGKPSEQGLMHDAAAAYAFTTSRYRPDNIVVWGFSLGTGVAVALAAEQRIGKLILEAPYTSVADVAASMFWFAPVRLLIRDQFRSDSNIPRVKVPLLVMHGALDPAIPVTFGERLFALANEPKRFVRIARGAHNDLDNFGGIEIARNYINLAEGSDFLHGRILPPRN
jgi:uncharacterized protein